MSGSAIKFDKRVAVLAYRLRKLAHLQEQDAERVARLLAESKVKSVKEAIDVDIRAVYHKIQLERKRVRGSGKKSGTMHTGPPLSPIPLGKKLKTVADSPSHSQAHTPQPSRHTMDSFPSNGSQASPSSRLSASAAHVSEAQRVAPPLREPLHATLEAKMAVGTQQKQEIGATGFISPLRHSAKARIPASFTARQARKSQSLERVFPRLPNETDWEYMTRLDAELYKAEETHTILSKHMQKREYSEELKKQLTRKGNPSKNEDARYRAQARSQARQYQMEQEKKKKEAVLQAKALKKEMNEVLADAERKKQQEEERRLAARMEMSRIAKQAAAEEALEHKMRFIQQQKFKNETVSANQAAIEAKRRAEQEERQAERRLLMEAELAAQAREAVRLEKVRKRKEDIEKKLSLMSSVFAARDEAEKLAAQRAEAQAKAVEDRKRLTEQIAAQKLAESEKQRAVTIKKQVEENRRKRQQQRKMEKALLEEALQADADEARAQEHKRIQRKKIQREQMEILRCQEEERRRQLNLLDQPDAGVVRANSKIIDAKLQKLAEVQARLNATKKAADLRPRLMQVAEREHEKWIKSEGKNSELNDSQQEFIDRMEQRMSRFASPHK